MAPALRGKYGAFAEWDSAGVRHLKELREAGLTHVHLLPTYDFATVPEREENQRIIEVCSSPLVRQFYFDTSSFSHSRVSEAMAKEATVYASILLDADPPHERG